MMGKSFWSSVRLIVSFHCGKKSIQFCEEQSYAFSQHAKEFASFFASQHILVDSLVVYSASSIKTPDDAEKWLVVLAKSAITFNLNSTPTKNSVCVLCCRGRFSDVGNESLDRTWIGLDSVLPDLLNR